MLIGVAVALMQGLSFSSENICSSNRMYNKAALFIRTSSSPLTMDDPCKLRPL
jgi:hypothetical protein